MIKKLMIIVMITILIRAMTISLFSGNVNAYVVGSPPTMLPPSYSAYAVDSAAADQGVTSTSNITLKNLVDEIGTGEQATIILSQTGALNQTTYTLTTNESVPKNQKVYFEVGAIIDGAGTLTLDSPGQIIAQPNQQIFGSSITISFTNSGMVYLPWYGADPTGATESSTEIHRAIVSANGNLIKVEGLYDVTNLGDTDITVPVKMEGDNYAEFDGANNATSRMNFDGSGTISSISIKGIIFDRMHSAVYAKATTDTISQFTFENNMVQNSKNGVWLNCIIANTMVRNNRFTTLSSTGQVNAIHLGTNTYASQDSMEKFIITGNEIYDLDSSTNNEEVHGIILYGREAIITDNILKSIINSGNGSGAEGIYTKCRWATIANNVLIDGGTDEGSIVVKGNRRGGSAAPQGYSVIVSDNLLYSSSGAYNGIFIANDDVLVTDNLVEGFGGYGIYTLHSASLADVSIQGNHIKNHRGGYAIYARYQGTNLRIVDNEISGLLSSQGAIANTYGISLYVYDGSLHEVEISTNHVYDNDTANATTTIRAIGIYVTNSKTLTRLTLQDNNISLNHSSINEYGISVGIAAGATLNGLKIKNNQISGNESNPFYSSFTGTVSGFVYEPMELGAVGTMIGHETFRVNDGTVFIKDPGGAARNFNPSGDFPDAFQVTLVNTADAAETITFDSTGLNQAIAQNERGIFAFDGTNWFKVYVGS